MIVVQAERFLPAALAKAEGRKQGGREQEG
jgi:hypothetical protein